jgi:hypothetical protein
MNNNLVTGLIQSSYNVEYIEKLIKYNTNFINLKNKYNFHINAMADTLTSKNKELTELLALQQEEQRKYRREREAYNSYMNDIQQRENALAKTELSNYERNKLQNELIRLRQRPKEKPTFEPSIRTQVRIDELRKSLDNRNLEFSGYLTIYKVVDPSLPEVREQYREISESLLVSSENSDQSVYNNSLK